MALPDAPALEMPDAAQQQAMREAAMEDLRATLKACGDRCKIPELPQCDYDTEEQTRQAADEASDKENANGGEDSPKGCPAPRQQPSDATLARAVAGMALGTAPRSPLAPLQASEPAAAGGTGQEPEAGGTPGKPEAAGDGSAAAKRHAAAAADETAAGRQVVAPPVADGAAAAGAAAGAVQVEPALRGLLRRLSQPFEEAAQGAAQLPLNLLEVQQHVALTTHIGPHMAEAAAAPGAQTAAPAGTSSGGSGGGGSLRHFRLGTSSTHIEEKQWCSMAIRGDTGMSNRQYGMVGQAVKEAVWTPLAKALAPSGAAGGDAVLAGLKPLLDRFVGLFAAGSSSDGGEGQRLAGEPCTGEPQQPFLLLRFHLGKKPKAGVQHGGAAYIKAGSTEVFVREGVEAESLTPVFATLRANFTVTRSGPEGLQQLLAGLKSGPALSGISWRYCAAVMKCNGVELEPAWGSLGGWEPVP